MEGEMSVVLFEMVKELALGRCPAQNTCQGSSLRSTSLVHLILAPSSSPPHTPQHQSHVCLLRDVGGTARPFASSKWKAGKTTSPFSEFLPLMGQENDHESQFAGGESEARKYSLCPKLCRQAAGEVLFALRKPPACQDHAVTTCPAFFAKASWNVFLFQCLIVPPIILRIRNSSFPKTHFKHPKENPFNQMSSPKPDLRNLSCIFPFHHQQLSNRTKENS